MMNKKAMPVGRQGFTHTPKFGVTLQSKGGFTLVEMIVTVAVFSVVMTVAVGAVLNVINIYRKVIAERTIQDNLNFALDVMTREIRMGDTYVKISNSNFKFIETGGDTIIYWLDSNDGLLKRKSLSNGKTFPLNDPQIVIDSLYFDVSGQLVGDNLQPLVTITLIGNVGVNDKSRSKIYLQTTVSQRSPDS